MTAAAPKRLLHLVRGAEPPAEAIALGDWIARSEGERWILADRGAPPIAAGPIDAAQLHDLIFAADGAITW
ncbi:MAG: hypothetical protein K8W52_29850 [Deltaproteobacteria bacterium]|nr:hypothetical protein [Deltaproteobacteria bacterium]